MPDEQAGAPDATSPPGAALPDAKPPSPGPATPPPESWETRFKYLLADFENFRKRVDRERESLRDQVRADLLQALLPAFEGALRAREAVNRLPATDPIRRGVELLAHEWETFFDGAKVSAVARSGTPFEAERHEAVAEAPVTPNHPEGTVVEIVQQGYRMGSLLLRPAKVVVARRATAGAPTGERPGEESTG